MDETHVNLRTGSRLWGETLERNADVGFRCCRSTDLEEVRRRRRRISELRRRRIEGFSGEVLARVITTRRPGDPETSDADCLTQADLLADVADVLDSAGSEASERKPAVVESTRSAEDRQDAAAEPEATPAPIQALFDRVALKLSGKTTGAPKTIQFDLGDEGIYRLVIDAEGQCTIEPGDGEAVATLKMKADTARKFLTGQLSPMVAMTTGQIKAEGDMRALMALQGLR